MNDGLVFDLMSWWRKGFFIPRPPIFALDMLRLKHCLVRSICIGMKRTYNHTL